MSNPTMLTPIPGQARSLQEQYGYPTTARAFGHLDSEGEVHTIFYAGAPGALFNNAPNCSVFIDTTNSDVYIKNGTWGAKDGSWVKASP
jgi:hypothetical protein